MRASSEEAILLFDKWRLDGSHILCVAVSHGWRSSFKGKITSRTGSTFELSWPDGGTGMLVISLDIEGIRFAYAASPELPSLDKDASGIVVEMPLRISSNGISSADRFTFIEMSPDALFGKSD